MITEAVSADYYHLDGWGQDYPRIQILTIDDLLRGHTQVKMPPQFGTFKQAQKVQQKSGVEQQELGFAYPPKSTNAPIGNPTECGCGTSLSKI